MALVKLGEKALAVAKDMENDKSKITKLINKKVLEEEQYTEDLEKIIQRDFFPDLEKLRAQKDYMEARDNNDFEKMRDLALKYGSTRPRRQTETPGTAANYTPATFETPDVNRRLSPGQSHRSQSYGINQENPGESSMAPKSSSDLSLDEYLARNTSEDNASFSEIVRDTEDKLRQKHAWLYQAEKRHAAEQEQTLALLAPEQTLAIESGTGNKEVITWGYRAKNSLMYIPEGLEETPEEQVRNKDKPRLIVHDNTRFQSNPFNMEKQKEAVSKAATVRKLVVQGKIGPDGKEILPEETPRVNGFSMVRTPVIQPGTVGDESPLMTWGEIEGTPFRLDSGETPLLNRTPGPSFKMPDVPRKEKLAHSLADKVIKKNRAKKQEALKRVADSFTSPSPGSFQLSSMSPAAQRLFNRSKFSSSRDSALRASYTPSPTHRTRHTPGRQRPPRLTPSRVTPRDSTPSTTPSTPSITDNLLQIKPKSSQKARRSQHQAKATDFF